MHRAHTSTLLLTSILLVASLAPSAVMASESEPPMPLVYPLEELSLAKFSGGLTLRVKCGSQNELMVETSNEKAFSFKDKGDEIVVKRKSIRKLLSLGKDDANVRATLTVSGELPDLNLATGVNASVAPCDAPQSIFKVNIGTGSNMVLARGAFDTLEVDANTGSSFEVDARTTTNQLYLDLDTGSTFFGGPQLEARSARVQVSTGSTANICGAETVTGKVSTGGDIRVKKTANVEVDKGVTGGSIRRSSC